MFDFSIKECLIKLQGKNYGNDIKSTISIIVEKFDEQQIRSLSQYQGLKIDNKIIRLYFYENCGFRCMNEKDHIYGKLPICRNIEKFMNELYLESVNKQYDMLHS
jgi:hypothetical protein